MSCVAGLIQFYRSECDSGRRDLFLRYVHRLYDLHVKAENHAEAAITIRMHADLLRWTGRTLHADLRYPSQVRGEREKMEMMRLFVVIKFFTSFSYQLLLSLYYTVFLRCCSCCRRCFIATTTPLIDKGSVFF